MDIKKQFATSPDYEKLPYFGEGITDNNPHGTENGKPPPYLGGYNVSHLTAMKGNTVKDLEDKGFLCVFCEGVIRKAKQTPCGDRTCTNCCAHWVYLNQNASGKAPCPVGHLYNKKTDIVRFRFTDCKDDPHYNRHASKQIKMSRCPLTTTDGKKCQWSGETLFALNSHIPIAHPDINDDRRQNLWDYYQLKDRQILSQHAPSSAIDSSQGFDNLAFEEDTQLLKPISPKFVNPENKSQKSPLHEGRHTQSAQASCGKQNILTSATINEASKKPPIEHEKKSNFIHPALSPSVNQAGSPSVNQAGWMRYSETNHQAHSASDQASYHHMNDASSSLSPSESTELLADDMRYPATVNRTDCANNDEVKFFNDAIFHQSSLESVPLAFSDTENSYSDTDLSPSSSNNSPSHLDNVQHLSLASLEASLTQELKCFGTYKPTHSSNDQAAYQNQKAKSPVSSRQLTDNTTANLKIDSLESKIIADNDKSLEEFDYGTFFHNFETKKMSWKKTVCPWSCDQSAALVNDRSRVAEIINPGTDHGRHKLSPCHQESHVPHQVTTVGNRTADGTTSYMSWAEKQSAMTNCLINECNIGHQDIRYYIPFLEGLMMSYTNKTLEELDRQAFVRLLERAKNEILTHIQENQASGGQVPQAENRVFSESATAQMTPTDETSRQLQNRRQTDARNALSDQIRTHQKRLLRAVFEGIGDQVIETIYNKLHLLCSPPLENLSDDEFHRFINECAERRIVQVPNVRQDQASGAQAQANSAQAQINGAQTQENGAQAQQKDHRVFSESATAEMTPTDVPCTQLQNRGQTDELNALSRAIETHQKALLSAVFQGIGDKCIEQIYQKLKTKCNKPFKPLESLNDDEFHELLFNGQFANRKMDKVPNVPQAQSSGAQAQTNSARTQANGAQAQSNSARAHANSAQAQTNSARAQANGAQTQANSARAHANSAQAQANSAQAQTNSAQAQANSVQAQANGAQAQANPNVFGTQLQNRVETNTANFVSTEITDKKTLLGTLFPGATPKGISIIYSKLNEECLLLDGKSLEKIETDKFYTFVTDRMAVRGTLDKGIIHKWQTANRIPDEQIEKCMKDYKVEHELEISWLTNYPKTEKNTCFYRIGTYEGANDEQGKVINYKLGIRIFEQEDVNVKQAALGYGLYAGTTRKTALDYTRQNYNYGRRIAILEIVPQQELSLVTLNRLSNGVNESVKNNKCHHKDCLYLGGLNNTVVLIKDADQIQSIKAFHPNLRTKVSIPFTREQIERNALRQKEATADYVKTLKQIGVHLHSPVFSPYQPYGKTTTVYEYEVRLSHDVAQRRGLSHPCTEIKYYIKDDHDSKKYVRVKIDAPLNDRGCVDVSTMRKPDQFYIQYYCPSPYQTSWL